MADEVKLTEDGLELHASIAEKMDDILETAAAGAAVSVTLGGALGAVVLIVDLIKLMTDDDQTPQVLRALQKQIDVNATAIAELKRRLNELVLQIGEEANRQRVLALDDLSQEVKQHGLDLQGVGADVERGVSVANAAGITVDKFLRFDFDAWRWVDVVRDLPPANPGPAPDTRVPFLRFGQFKTRPTLPIYLAAVLTWLAAREKVLRLGATDRLDDDRPRVERHLAAVSVRPTFDKYGTPPNSTPGTITEHIQSRIRSSAVSSTKFPIDGVCHYSWNVRNFMNGSFRSGDPFELRNADPAAQCGFVPSFVGMPNLEIAAEAMAGVPDLLAIADVLARVRRTGSVAGEFVGEFPGPSAIFYVVESSGDLTWYENKQAAAPEGSTVWAEPRKVGEGWSEPLFAFNGGGSAVYAVFPDGTLDWFGHDGAVDGSERWSGPNPIGEGWAMERVFSGGDGVLYAVLANGDLQWHRHIGAHDGTDEWVQMTPENRIVGTGWSGLRKVFSPGDGVIYIIDQDGVLKRLVHKGHLTGNDSWGKTETIGQGFADFPEVIAFTSRTAAGFAEGVADGELLYVFTRDGRVLRHRCFERDILISFNPATGATTSEKAFSLEPAVEVRRITPGFLRAFARLPVISGGVVVN